MHLISALIAGVSGAENGTVDLVLRGTSTPATCYVDFEATSNFIGSAVPLDARGSAKVYVNDVVRVMVKSALGATVIDFVDGAAANSVEVRSTSFTGTAYSGGSGLGLPITLKTLLDKWDDSAGAPDWKVLYNGASTNLSTVVSSLSANARTLYNVKSYGAVGDGIVNDTSAVNSAISAAAAAGGGIAYFPPGTYLLNTLTCSAVVQVQGAGRGSSIIRMATDVPFCFFQCPPRIEGLAFTYAVAHTSQTIYINPGSAATEIVGCSFATSRGSHINDAWTTTHTLLVKDCIFTGDASGIWYGVEMAAGSLGWVTVLECIFQTTGSGGQARGVYASATTPSLLVANCQFNMGSLAAGVAYGVEGSAVAANLTMVYGCSFIGPSTTAAWFCISSTAALVESGNLLQPTVDFVSAGYSAYSLGASNVLAQLGSRATLRAVPTDPNADPLTLPISHVRFIAVEVTSTAAHVGNVGVGVDGFAPIGCDAVVTFVNKGTGGLLTFQWDANFASSAATFTVANNTSRVFHLVVAKDYGGTKKWYIVSDLAGAQA